MINEALINPQSIVIVGGSNNTKKPGGKILKNILDGGYSGTLQVVNHHEKYVQGIPCVENIEALENVDLAIISIPAKSCPNVCRKLAEQKQTKAFIILSAGFSEAGEEGGVLEQELVAISNANDVCLIGPNCIGILNLNYNGVFTTPIPQLDRKGCDLISSSGATAVFLMEAGIPLGLRFSNVFSVGNSAQVGVEEVLEYMDLNYNPEEDSSIKLLYLESISNPKKLLKHAQSLIKKGVRIAAIKAGSTEAGSRAAASHTGAMMNSDVSVRALFDKAGIAYCSSREELLSVASIYNYKPLKGKNIAIITHAGGSAVMLTDALTTGGLCVPKIEGPNADKLLSFLNPGSSIGNPIDFLATGTAEQLGIIIDYCEHKFDEIEAMVVVFGSPGLFDVKNVYDVLSVKLEVCSKPIFPVLPSVINAQNEISDFLAKGNINFPDEVMLGRALAVSSKSNREKTEDTIALHFEKETIRSIIDNARDGFLKAEDVAQILDAVEIPRAHEYLFNSLEKLIETANNLPYPIAMKTIGVVHKTDVGGVILNVNSAEEAINHFEKLMKTPLATGVLVQPMINGMELFIGVNKESNFDHAILCGLGGIFIEVLNDYSYCLSPVSTQEANEMIKDLRGYKLIKGMRGKKGVDENKFSEIIRKVSLLTQLVPEISEMDINPLIASEESIIAVDTRIKIIK